MRASALYFVFTCGGTATSLAAMIRLVDLGEPSSCAWWAKWVFWFVEGSLLGRLLTECSIRSNYSRLQRASAELPLPAHR